MNKNKWKSNRGLKIALTVISFLMAAAVFFSGAAVFVIGSLGAYNNSKEECLENHYERYSEIYAVMAMANRESSLMQAELDKTNFRYGIIKDEDLGAEGVLELSEIKKISDPASYEYCNFETMPAVDAIEKGEVRVDEFEIGEGTRYSWDCRLFGYANVYDEVYDQEDVSWVTTEEVPIIGYYYNVFDGIFYYETDEECYRVDEVELYVGNNNDMKMRFKFDSGQGAYYNLNREECVVKDYYLTFNEFDDFSGRSWETWDIITLDGVELFHTDIRFVEDVNTDRGEFIGKPVATRFYSYNDGSGVLKVRADGKEEEGDIVKSNGRERYWVISQVREPLMKTGIRDGFLQGDLFEQTAFVLDLAYAWRYPAIFILVVSLILWAVSTILVLVAAGHKGSYEVIGTDTKRSGPVRRNVLLPEEESPEQAENVRQTGGVVQEGTLQQAESALQADGGAQDENGTDPAKVQQCWIDAVKPGFWQKIPLDVETCLIAFLGCIFIWIGAELTYYGISPWNIVFAVMCCFGCYLISFIWLVDFVVRVKLGKWWRSMLTYQCFAWAGRKTGRFVKKLIRFLQENLSLLWKAILILGGISLLEFCGILVTGYSPEAELSMWFLYRFSTVVLILVGIVQANRLKEGTKKLADGNLQEKISTEKMFWEFKKHGENLNSINDGISLAVEKRMQSEHFRTELITNVSHDIKTPLTSIINYVDLLQKEEIDNEKAKEYLEVLDRQSSRLKKLTEDLIEASKASTGSMPVQIEQIELGVFLTQTVGEFEEKLAAAGLRVVMHKPEAEVFVNADGRHLWRVVENLVQNICKYAQPDTRVYIDLDENEKEAVISFKNVSRYELNISGDELMERFVRGDASRHTDGSGLGLSIAGSLMELMHGKLEIVVDGDLFKVVLHFPK